MELGITRFFVSMKYTGLLKSQRQPSFSSGQDLCRVQCGTWEKRECNMHFPCLNFRAISWETSCLAATKTKTKRVATKTFFIFFFGFFRVTLALLSLSHVTLKQDHHCPDGPDQGQRVRRSCELWLKLWRYGCWTVDVSYVLWNCIRTQEGIRKCDAPIEWSKVLLEVIIWREKWKKKWFRAKRFEYILEGFVSVTKWCYIPGSHAANPSTS